MKALNYICFSVTGEPQPKGSFRPGYNTSTKKYYLKNDCSRTGPWQTLISLIAKGHKPRGGPWAGPVALQLHFRFKRPKSHPKSSSQWHSVKPDLDKLTRAVKDALTGIIYEDDARVVRCIVEKKYGEPGMPIEAHRLDFSPEDGIAETEAAHSGTLPARRPLKKGELK